MSSATTERAMATIVRQGDRKGTGSLCFFSHHPRIIGTVTFSDDEMSEGRSIAVESVLALGSKK